MILNSDLVSEKGPAHHATKEHSNARGPFSRLILVLRAKPSDNKGKFHFQSPQNQNYTKSEFSTNSPKAGAECGGGGCRRWLRQTEPGSRHDDSGESPAEGAQTASGAARRGKLTDG